MASNTKLFVVAGLLVGLALAVFVSPFASGSPDGLEKVSEEEGFAEAARDHDLGDSPLADYGVSGVDDERVGTGLAGLVGVLLTLGVGLAVFAGVRALRPSPPEPAEDERTGRGGTDPDVRAHDAPGRG